MSETIEIQKPMTDKEELRILVDDRNAMQKKRIAQGNRIDAVMQGRDVVDDNMLERYRQRYSQYLALEKSLDSDIESVVNDLPIFHEMVKVKGVGPSLSAQIVSMVDITLVDSVSAMWKWCGLGVTDGEADRLRKGEKATFNPRLKSVLLKKIGDSFLKSKSPYAVIYYESIEYYTEKNLERDADNQRTLAHIKNMARRKMVKLFVSHLWEVWRRLEGLETPDPYVFAILNHKDKIWPADMGWQ